MRTSDDGDVYGHTTTKGARHEGVTEPVGTTKTSIIAYPLPSWHAPRYLCSSVRLRRTADVAIASSSSSGVGTTNRERENREHRLIHSLTLARSLMNLTLQKKREEGS